MESLCAKEEHWQKNENKVCVCLSVQVCVSSVTHICFGAIVLETALFLDAIITQATQGLRLEKLPYIKV